MLLIIGGIIYGLRGNQNKNVANLPQYSPVHLASATPSPEPSVSIPAIATASPIRTVKGTATSKPTQKKTTTATAASLPIDINETNLPIYSPVVSLPDYQPQTSSPTALPIEQQNVTIKVPGTSYTVIIDREVKVIDVLHQAKTSGLSFKTQSYTGLGELITEINGQSQGNNRFWTYTVNNVCVSKGISSQTVKASDSIELFLTNEAESPCA